MNLDQVFFVGPRLRPIWRFFLSIILVFVVYVIAGVALGTTFRSLHYRPPTMVAFFFATLLVLPGILASFKLLTRVFDGRPLGSMGLAFHPRWGRELLYGVGVGAVMLVSTVALERAGGYAHFSPLASPAIWQSGVFTFVLLGMAAINEEITFRGYPFQRLMESVTPAGAIAVSSALFGLLHLGNPHHTWISTLNTMLVGIPFAIAYLRTRSLWMPVGMHFIWNFLMSFVFGLPVSGIDMANSVFAARVQGPEWITGGEYGPEGGVLATIVIVFATLYLSFSKCIYTTEEMKALVDGPDLPPEPDQPNTILAANPREEPKETDGHV